MSSGDAEITAFLAEWAPAEQAGDTRTLDPQLVDGFVGVGPLGFISSKQDSLQRFARGLQYGEFSLDDPQVRTI